MLLRTKLYQNFYKNYLLKIPTICLITLITKVRTLLSKLPRQKPTKSLVIEPPPSVKPETVGSCILGVNQRGIPVLVEAAVRVRRPGGPSGVPAEVERLEGPLGRDDGADLRVAGVVAGGQGAEQQHDRRRTRKHLVQNDELRVKRATGLAVVGGADTRQLSPLLDSVSDLRQARRLM